MQVKPKSVLLAMSVLLLLASPGFAQQHNRQSADDQYMAAMKTMNQNMKAVTDPNPAQSFAKKMIEHHSGAVAMSEIVLQHAKDPAIRKIAHQTIRENTKGIKELRKWLKQHHR